MTYLNELTIHEVSSSLVIVLSLSVSIFFTMASRRIFDSSGDNLANCLFKSREPKKENFCYVLLFFFPIKIPCTLCEKYFQMSGGDGMGHRT